VNKKINPALEIIISEIAGPRIKPNGNSKIMENKILSNKKFIMDIFV
tara:strand:+ start:189 stop:329 length:141 start_codon:yes stop_codon:yes gene_type:complete